MGQEGFYYLPTITMKKTETMVKMDATPEKRLSPSKLKSFMIGLFMVLSGFGTGEVFGQISDSSATKNDSLPPKTEMEAPK